MIKARKGLKAAAVRKLFDYDPATGTLIWKWREGKYSNMNQYAGKIAGKINTGGYREIRVNGVSYGAHRLAWLHYHGRWPKEQIDHINRDPLDNRIENLREASCSQNQANRCAQRNNKSGYKGVWWSKQVQKWQGEIKVNKKRTCLGYFETAAKAHAAYCAAAKELHGKFARTV